MYNAFSVVSESRSVICTNPVGNRLAASVHPAEVQWHSKVILTAYMRTFKHCRLRTGRTLCKTYICLCGTTIKILQTECQNDCFYPKQVAKRLLKIKIKISKTYMQRHTMTENSKPQQKHCLGTVSENLTWRWPEWGGGGGGWGGGHNPRPYFCGIHKTFVQSA